VNQPLVLYGAGERGAVKLKESREKGYNPVCFCDGDINKQGKQYLGLPVLNLEQAKAAYSNFQILVTPNPPIYYEIIEYLIVNGVKSEQIIDYMNSEHHYIKSCVSLENYMIVADEELQYCCGLGNLRNPPPRIKLSNENIEKSIEKFIDYRGKLINDINSGKDTICSGCPELKYGWYPKKKKITSLSYSIGCPCNMFCIYCHARPLKLLASPELKQWRKIFDFSKMLRIIEDYGNVIDTNCVIELSAGEITADPKANDILDAVMSYPVRLFSNCIIYSDKAAKIIRKQDSFLIESLDAGTKKTFTIIKGIDVFDRVLKNIHKYAENGGNIQLKYIVIPENSNEQDFDGFVQICKEIRVQKVRISCSIYNDFSNFPKSIVNSAITLGKKAVEAGLDVLVLDHFGSDYDDYIKFKIFEGRR